jgi:hypothetical protein
MHKIHFAPATAGAFTNQAVLKIQNHLYGLTKLFFIMGATNTSFRVNPLILKIYPPNKFYHL